jgi:Bax protein
MKMFESASLGVVALLVAVLMGITLYDPPAKATVAPKAVLPVALVAPPRAKKLLPGGLGDLARATSGVTVRKLSDTFNSLDYDLNAVISGDGEVPRLFLASFPEDFRKIRQAKKRKALFFLTVLPLILQVNEEILADRRRLWDLRYRTRTGLHLEAADWLWLIVMSERYGVGEGDIDALLRRVDIIPTSLALAQAAEESGWGTSRFAREGNAIFGQWTFARDGNLVPRRRDNGKFHNIRAFETLLDGAKTYAKNLNTHRAYRGFRELRAGMRNAGRPVEGAVLAGTLSRYSERGPAYIETILSIITANGLGTLDDARLRAQGRDFQPLI